MNVLVFPGLIFRMSSTVTFISLFDFIITIKRHSLRIFAIFAVFSCDKERIISASHALFVCFTMQIYGKYRKTR